MKLIKERRRRYLVDSRVQGALIREIVGYWLWISVTFALIVLLYRVAPVWLAGRGSISGQVWFHLFPLVLASAVLFPLVVYSAIRFSNRFVGPMLRFRRALKELADGGSTATLSLRKGDYWADVAGDINEITARLEAPQPDEVDSLASGV